MVTSLLEVYLRANPTRAKTDEEKREIADHYKPGDIVMSPLPKGRNANNSNDDEDEDDRRLIEEIRELSLRTAQGYRPDDSRRAHGRRRSRDRRRENGDERDADGSRRRRHGEARNRQEPRERMSSTPVTDGARNRPAQVPVTTPSHLVEHQSSLRSLLSSSDMGSSEIEQQIARQIIEEGLLDGIDLSRIDMSQEDEISERIAEAYRRRHGDRNARPRGTRGDSDGDRPLHRERNRESRQRTHRRSHSAALEGRERRQESSSQTSLDASSVADSRQRRRSDNARRSTSPIVSNMDQGHTSDVARVAARSFTELSNSTRTSHAAQSRPIITSNPGRSTTDPGSGPANQRQQGNEQTHKVIGRRELMSNSQTYLDKSEDNQASNALAPSPPQATASLRPSQDHQPRPVVPRLQVPSQRKSQSSSTSHQTLPTTSAPARTRPSLFPEPSISCARCGKQHIEYGLHYNCPECENGDYNICLSCYRHGRGCKNWYGFGYAAWSRYEGLAPAEGYPPGYPLPHSLTGRRYLRPTQEPAQPGSADNNRRLLTTEDPLRRLQAGLFCSMCASFSNDCFWKCDICNEGEWGFCNKCVHTGKCCTHPLLAVMCVPPKQAMSNQNASQIQPPPPPLPTTTTSNPSNSPRTIEHSSLQPLSISTACNICHLLIQPSSTRYHCPQCNEGNYDICSPCYLKLCASGKISPENGNKGWRRCLRGHRMVVVGFEDRNGGRKRIIVRDLVGGSALKEEKEEDGRGDDNNNNNNNTQRGENWSWKEGPDGRMASKTISKIPTTVATAAAGAISSSSSTTSPSLLLHFPPDGGIGMRVLAQWSYYPAEGITDELMFPRGAEIREVEDINGDWFWGCYAGSKGLFPGNYVRVLDVVGM